MQPQDEAPEEALKRLYVYLYNENDRFRPLQPRAFSSKLKRLKKAQLKMQTRHLSDVIAPFMDCKRRVKPMGMKQPRERDRRIRQIVAKLTAWAELYNGVLVDDNETGQET